MGSLKVRRGGMDGGLQGKLLIPTTMFKASKVGKGGNTHFAAKDTEDEKGSKPCKITQTVKE